MVRFLYIIVLIFFVNVNVSVNAAETSIVTVVNASVTLTSISPNLARQIFGMKTRQWPNGTPIYVFVMPDKSEQHLHFSKEILDTFPYRLRSAWDRQVYSGTGQAPREVTSEDEVLELVSNTPGAIGYLPKSKVHGIKLRMIEVR